jgi:hypothetical protein
VSLKDGSRNRKIVLVVFVRKRRRRFQGVEVKVAQIVDHALLSGGDGL